LRGHVVATPCLHARTLSDTAGASLYLKFENLQFTASFKERGARNKLESLSPAERRAGVVAASAGNHAQAVAFHARQLGIPAAIVMPRQTPDVKVEHTRAFGAEVVLDGDSVEEALAHAERIARERGRVFVHPYDDPLVIAGQGTVALEMLDAVPALEVLVVPVGGGGLVSGMALAAKARRSDLRVIGVEPTRVPSMRCALLGEPVPPAEPTVADGLAVRQPGRLTRELVRRYVDDVLLVEEDQIEEALLLLLEVEKTVVEGAGAAALAAVLAHRERFSGRQVGLVLSGGNVDPLRLSGMIERGLVRSGRLTSLRVRVRDVSAALAEIVVILARTGARVVAVHHERAFTGATLDAVDIDFVLETRGPAHVREIAMQLNEGGFRPVDLQAGGR
jgi:threonine dehydratase